MAEKRVSVRLAVVGGREVRAELQGIGDAGEQGFRRLSREMDAANSRVAAFYRRVQIAAAAAATAFAAGAAVMIRSGLQVVDAQAKLAQSLGTTVESIQVLERAGELAGVSMSGIEQATKDLTRRLSQAAAGTGPAVAALERLGLSASALLALPLDERVGRINQAIEDFVPAAERAAVAGQLFGEEGSIAISRIDTTTLRQATQDVRDFGVVVSEQDADQIERTNDAISRLGLIWRGLSNQLAVAAAPALEAVADALAAISRSTGPLGQAIRRLFDNIGRLASIAAAFAAFIAGRWVAGMVVAAASVRGLATALVFLRGALIRTGIGALIVAAGELIYQFGRLVQATGGFGAALGLLGDVAAEVWDRIGLLAGVLKARVSAAWSGIQASIADALQASLEAVVAFGNRTIGTFQGAFEAMVVIWSNLPRAIGDLTIQAANALIAGLESMLNGAVDGINGLLEGVNAGLSAIGIERAIELVPDVDLGRIENEFAGAASLAGNAARDAFAAAFETDTFAAPDFGLSAFAGDARAAADSARETAAALGELAGAPLASIAALREAMAGANTEIDNAAGATERLDDAFAAIGGAGGDAAGDGEGSAGSAARAAEASRAAGEAAASSATQAATGWAAVREELSRYASEAMDWGKGLGSALTSAFRSAEDAIANFVTGGKIDFKALADSILADITRIAVRSAILGPLANALGGGSGGLLGGFFGGGGGLFAGIFHQGGVAGGPAQQRLVPALAFAGAPRFHDGGVAGLRADEVPAILQRGEMVLSRAQLAAIGAARETRPPVNVVMNISTPDAGSFRYAQGQIAADAARAMERARRNL
ncbi:MAG: phage tail tape-measure protein [Alphaproteobacteria bacterium]|nr:phage tail tape-measure protein [Alphaproteobacteria bacterium]MAS48728.1 phage tail tape-measure protein [Alphaproteobacteria bacterium]MBN52883.1 phage tail tape-measure protein [Alphaproteobacteria bacterium]OUT39364.1 MAG: phage tail tape-measure protein [Micavibrio sp. TMED2]